MRGVEVTRECSRVGILLRRASLERLQVGPGGRDVRGEPLAFGDSSLSRGSQRGSELGRFLVSRV